METENGREAPDGHLLHGALTRLTPIAIHGRLLTYSAEHGVQKEENWITHRKTWSSKEMLLYLLSCTETVAGNQTSGSCTLGNNTNLLAGMQSAKDHVTKMQIHFSSIRHLERTLIIEIG